MTDRVGNAQTEVNRTLGPLPETGQYAGDLTLRMPDAPAVEIDPTELREILGKSTDSHVSKQERDFALAALLIRDRLINERTLRNLLKRWTPFGSVALGDLLLREQVIEEEVLTRAQRECEDCLRSLMTLPPNGPLPTAAQRTSTLLEGLDPAGSVAKLFGFSRIPKTLVGNQARTFRNQFRLIRKIGQGGLGTVWLAVDTSLNRYVALKELSGQSDANSPAAARFRREAEITGRLDHPGIVPIHLMGEDEQDGRLFYVMRFLGNETLADAIRDYHDRRESGQDCPMAFHRLLTAFVSVCQAVAFAHSNKVIHRDLKPQNIALDNFGQVIVLDWGLAKALGMEDPSASTLDGAGGRQQDDVQATLAGQVLGTPMYMAPEQASGRSDEIDERTDVYGLGAILFAILTGYAPHESSGQPRSADTRITNLLDAIVDRPVQRPRLLNPQIPPALEAICLKAVNKDRQARYPSAVALSEDLQRWLANEPVSAMREPLLTRLRRWISAHRGLSRSLVAVAVILASGTAFSAYSSWQSSVAAEQLRQRATVDTIRDLRNALSSEVERLSENTRFMSSLPAIQEIINARKGNAADPERQFTEQLRVIYNGLLEVHPSYTAVTCWVRDGKPADKPIRVENVLAQRGSQRTDLTEFFGRHLPGIIQLQRNEIYVGMPGRLVQLKPDPNNNQATLPEPVGHCLVAGVGVYDKIHDQGLGGVAIECDLEKLLRDHLETVDAGNFRLWLTDNQGRCVMRFTREEGLQPVDPAHVTHPGMSQMRPWFYDPLSSSLHVASSRLCAAKVPLSKYRPEHYMGLIMDFPDQE